jgi:hypothetical protein
MSKTQPKKTTASTSKDLDKAKMSAQDPKVKAQSKGSSKDFVLVDVLARKVLDWNHKPLKTPGAPKFGDLQPMYNKLWAGVRTQEGGCQAVLMNSTGQLSYARNTSGWSDSDDAGRHSEEALLLNTEEASIIIQGILITIEPCYNADGLLRYPGHECQAFFRGGRPLPSPNGPHRSFTPFLAYTPIFFLELQPLREQSSTTSRFLKGLPPSGAIEWLANAAGPRFGTVLKPLSDNAKDPGYQVAGQEYMEAADIYTALIGTGRGDIYSAKSFGEWNPTTCDHAVQVAVKQLFSSGATPKTASQSPASNPLVNTAGAIVVGAFAKGYGLVK